MKPTTVNNMTFVRRKPQERIAAILRMCKTGATRQHIELAAGINRRTVNSYLTFLRHTGQLHIAAWTREGIGQFYPNPIYKTGAGTDAPKPPRLTEHERQVRAWAKLKADPVRRARLREKRNPKPTTPSVFNWRGQPSILTRKAA